jgi:hypothetical protein
VIASLASERLRKFRKAVPGGRHSAVVELYLLDSELVSAFHAVFRAAEVLLRETIHRALSATFGQRWFDQAAFLAVLDPTTLSAICRAKQDATVGRRTPAAGGVVAQAMLGTWVQLLARGPRGQKEAGLWVPALSAAFQADQPATPHVRAEVHALAQRLNWARNRVNHCEPVVFGFPLVGQKTPGQALKRATPQQILDDTRAITAMMDEPMGRWLGTWTQIDTLLAEPIVTDALNFIAAQSRISLEGRR